MGGHDGVFGQKLARGHAQPFFQPDNVVRRQEDIDVTAADIETGDVLVAFEAEFGLLVHARILFEDGFFELIDFFHAALRLLVFIDGASVRLARPYRQRTGFSGHGVIPVAIGRILVVLRPHPFPAPDIIRAFVVEADVLEMTAPGRFWRRRPFFHFLPTVRADGFVVVHITL